MGPLQCTVGGLKTGSLSQLEGHETMVPHAGEDACAAATLSSIFQPSCTVNSNSWSRLREVERDGEGRATGRVVVPRP